MKSSNWFFAIRYGIFSLLEKFNFCLSVCFVNILKSFLKVQTILKNVSSSFSMTKLIVGTYLSDAKEPTIARLVHGLCTSCMVRSFSHVSLTLSRSTNKSLVDQTNTPNKRHPVATLAAGTNLLIKQVFWSVKSFYRLWHRIFSFIMTTVGYYSGKNKIGTSKFRTKIEIRDFSVGIFGQKLSLDVQISGQKTSQDRVVLFLIKFKTVIFDIFRHKLLIKHDFINVEKSFIYCYYFIDELRT